VPVVYYGSGGTVPKRPSFAGQIDVSTESVSVNEQRFATITLTRSGGLAGAVTVDLAISGLADAGYSDNTVQVSWSDGETGDKDTTISLPTDISSDVNGSFSVSNAQGDDGVVAPTLGVSSGTVTVNIAPTVATSIDVGIKRYDNGSGSATFSGTVPFKPGQVQDEAALLSSVSLWDGGSQLPLYIEALTPRHPDGSIKAALLQTSYSLSSGQKDLTLRLDAGRTAGVPSKMAVGTSWMEAPTLLGCTDRHHLCASRISLLPLVPYDHPNLPQVWRDFLTTDFDSLDTNFPTGYNAVYAYDNGYTENSVPYGYALKINGATYNGLSTYYMRYLISGDLDRLYWGHYVSIKGFGLGGWSWSVPAEDGLRDGDTGENIFMDFVGANKATSTTETTNYSVGSEWYKGRNHDAWYNYVMSGWDQPKYVLIREGARDYGTIGASTIYGVRRNWRYDKEAAALLAMLNIDQSFTWWAPGASFTAPSYPSNKAFPLLQDPPCLPPQPASDRYTRHKAE